MNRLQHWMVRAMVLSCIVATIGATPLFAENAATGARLWQGMGDVNHPVSTSSPEAQKYFNQGMAFLYGFNHDEALRSFESAAEIDPNMAMAYWGIALAVGPNYNLPIDHERERKAYNAIQKALKTSAKGPEVERDYINALAKRYTNQPTDDYMKLEAEYNAAMAALSQKYPDDLDAATLYAESGMNLRPWKLWNPDGTPAPGTETIIKTLQSVLKRDPNHLGANHYYIHAVEASQHPEWALPSAQKLADLAPGAGHLVHMPAHIYIRTGNHEGSEHTNQLAATADEKYISESKVQGIYPMMYYTHNLHFITLSNAMLGSYQGATAGAKRVEQHVGPHLKDMPMLDHFATMPTVVLVRFRKWDDILKLPQPEAKLAMSTGMWHFARGMAFASKGEVDKARIELESLRKRDPEMAKMPTGAPGPGNAQRIPKIAAYLVEARIASAQKDTKSAITHLREAVALEDQMDYTEPPDWFYPVRETLGGTLLMSGDAAAAETVFREDLEKNPRNPRSLFGLMESLKAQKKPDAAYVQQQFEKTWKNADVKLQISDL